MRSLAPADDGWIYICAGSSTHRRTTTNRVILKLEESQFEIGSIGIQHGGAWSWGIDTIIPVRSFETEGEGRDRRGRVK